MASTTSDITKMIVEYEWILEDSIKEEPMTITSKMILFRGEKVFRVGLKNLVKSPLLFFVAVDLNKIGIKVKEVMWGQILDGGISPATMCQMTKQEIGDEGNLHLFKSYLQKQVIGTRIYRFRIYIEGSVPGFSYQLSDRLAKNQLWDSATVNSQSSAVDVELNVRDRTFSAHKAILAARSPVFANQFVKKQPLKNSPQKIQIDGVEPTTFEQFLYFIYTGESISSFANEELLKLADDYQLATLAGLCRTALKKIETTQMVNLTSSLHDNPEIPYPSIIRPNKDTEIFLDRTTPTFQCSLSFEGERSNKSKSMMQYHNEDIFSAYFAGEKVTNPTDKTTAINKPVIHFSCSKHRKFGLKIEDVYCKHMNSTKWIKMESKHFQKNAELLQHFTAQSEFDFKFGFLTTVHFDIKIVSTIGNYYYEVMDDDWMEEFWAAAINKELTDVEIFVGTVKVMEAHRVILSARSPVMNEAINKINDTGKSVLTFDGEFDVAVVNNFLNFLYTGSLKTFAVSSESPNYKQLLKLATKYEVETLKNICQLANHVPDVEELINCLLLL